MIYPAAIGLLVGTLLLIAAHAAHRRLERHRASVDTHPKDGDALAAPLVSGAVGATSAETPNTSHRSTGE